MFANHKFEELSKNPKTCDPIVVTIKNAAHYSQSSQENPIQQHIPINFLWGSTPSPQALQMPADVLKYIWAT